MTGVLAGSVSPGLLLVRRPRRDERWLSARRKGGGRVLRAELSIVAASILVHASILAIIVTGTDAGVVQPSPEPMPVEIVRDIPGEKPSQPPPVPARQQAMPAARPITTPEPVPTPKPELKPALAPKSEPAPKPEEAARPSRARQDLQDQLAALQAERAALKSEEGRLEQQAKARPTPGALGPLPDSFQAVALPSDAAGEGEAVGYAALVFSQLAKAKDIGRHMGQPGSAGVRFDIDAAGGLVDVELVVSSGVPALDAEALATVRKAAPFPVPPKGAQRSFSANVSFVAEGGAP